MEQKDGKIICTGKHARVSSRFIKTVKPSRTKGRDESCEQEQRQGLLQRESKALTTTVNTELTQGCRDDVSNDGPEPKRIRGNARFHKDNLPKDWRPPRPKYSSWCQYDEAGKPCDRVRCPSLHDDQTEYFDSNPYIEDGNPLYNNEKPIVRLSELPKIPHEEARWVKV